MKIPAFSFLILLGSSGISDAQNPQGKVSTSPSASKPELPPGPLLKPVGAYAQWEVTFIYPDDKKDKPPTGFTIDPRPRRTLTTKTEEIVHEEVTDIFNHRTDSWLKGGTQYQKSGSNPVWFEAHAGVRGDTNYTPLPTSGFRNLDWITAENYAGTFTTSDNRQCLIFSPGGYQKLDLNDPSRNDKMAAADTIAYIDADTRWPITVRVHGTTRVYRFRPVPSQTQTLPDDLTDQVKKGEEARARALQPAARPY